MTASTPTRAWPWRWMSRWMSPWFSAYALAGLLVNGMVPIMLPVTARAEGPQAVAIVVAAFFAGQLASPLSGRLADARSWQRPLWLLAFPVMALAAVALGVGSSLWVWIPAALVAGAIVPGQVAGLLGYGSFLPIAAAVMVLALAVGARILVRRPAAAAAGGPGVR